MNSSKQMAEAIICQIDKSRQAQLPYLVALDGRCASGKTTTATLIAEKYQKEGFPCDVVHMDNFFLQPNQRTSARLAEPGGNVDYERVEAEVLQPAKRGMTVSYRRFDCSRMELTEMRTFQPQGILLVEGAYSCHPKLREYFDLRIFVSIDPEMQMQRILLRNGSERAEMFRNRWIPLEEKTISRNVRLKRFVIFICAQIKLGNNKGVCSVDQGSNQRISIQI